MRDVSIAHYRTRPWAGTSKNKKARNRGKKMQFAKIMISTAAAAALLTIGAGQASAKSHVTHPRTAAEAPMGKSVKNPSGGLIGQPQNFPTAGTTRSSGNFGTDVAPNNFPKNPTAHRDTSNGDTR